MIVTEPLIYPKGGYYSKMKLSLGVGRRREVNQVIVLHRYLQGHMLKLGVNINQKINLRDSLKRGHE